MRLVCYGVTWWYMLIKISINWKQEDHEVETSQGILLKKTDSPATDHSFSTMSLSPKSKVEPFF